jgi:hypothetical protein
MKMRPTRSSTRRLRSTGEPWSVEDVPLEIAGALIGDGVIPCGPVAGCLPYETVAEVEDEACAPVGDPLRFDEVPSYERFARHADTASPLAVRN